MLEESDPAHAYGDAATADKREAHGKVVRLAFANA
jgi:hypothetical protein